jgi:hypothetical protein
VTLVSLAFAFLRSEQSRSKKNFWLDVADDAAATAGWVDSTDRPVPVVPDDL